jgi:hypothetical protein
MTYFTKKVLEELRNREVELSSARISHIEIRSCQEIRARICKKTTIKRDDDQKKVAASATAY